VKPVRCPRSGEGYNRSRHGLAHRPEQAGPSCAHPDQPPPHDVKLMIADRLDNTAVRFARHRGLARYKQYLGAKLGAIGDSSQAMPGHLLSAGTRRVMVRLTEGRRPLRPWRGRTGWRPGGRGGSSGRSWRARGRGAAPGRAALRRLLWRGGLLPSRRRRASARHADAVVLKQRRHQRVLVTQPDAGVAAAPASRRPGHAARGPGPGVGRDRDRGVLAGVLRRGVQELLRDHPAPGYQHHRLASCRTRDVTGSCQSSVETRP
jgi:hypothetical protein